MKRIVAALVAAWCCGAPARAQTMTPGLPVVPLGYCQLSVTGTAAGLSSCSGGIPSGANFAVFSVETAAVRWRDDGAAPTASVGMPIASGASPYTYLGTLSAIQFIAQSGSPVLDVAFYKSP